MIVYKVTNKNNGKIYIGQTQFSLHDRKLRHLYASSKNSQLRFHKAIRKHGALAFDWEVIFETEDKSKLFEKEIELIAEHRSFEYMFGYNACAGGTGGFVVPEHKIEK